MGFHEGERLSGLPLSKRTLSGFLMSNPNTIAKQGFLFHKYQRDLLQEGAGRGGEGRGRDKSLPFLEFKFTAYTHIIAKPSISLALVQELIQYECTPKSGDPFEYSIVMKFHKFLTLILPRSNMKLCEK